MVDQLRLKHDDFDGDAITASIRVTPIVGTDYAAFNTAVGNLQTNIDLWLIGRLHSVEHIISKVDNGPGKATSPIAQDSTQLILETQDTVTGVIYRERLPMPDLGKANDVGGDPAWLAVGTGSNSLTIANPAHSGWDALKAAYDACGVSPDGNPAVLVRAYIEE